jgi:hypothetical protein
MVIEILVGPEKIFVDEELPDDGNLVSKYVRDGT